MHIYTRIHIHYVHPQKSEHTLTHTATHTYAKNEIKKRKGKEEKMEGREKF